MIWSCWGWAHKWGYQNDKMGFMGYKWLNRASTVLNHPEPCTANADIESPAGTYLCHEIYNLKNQRWVNPPTTTTCLWVSETADISSSLNRNTTLCTFAISIFHTSAIPTTCSVLRALETTEQRLVHSWWWRYTWSHIQLCESNIITYVVSWFWALNMLHI